FVIPAFETMFKDFGGGRESLPMITRLMMGLSSAFVTYLPLLILLLIGGVVGFVYTYKQPRGKRFFHKTLLSLPIMGNVMSKIAVARFTRTLGTLLQSGVPILDALDICA